MKLTRSEEQLMEIIWRHETAFLKDILTDYPDPKPAGTTIVTLLKRMQEKGFVTYTIFGNSRQYSTLINKSDYFSKQVNGIIKNFFNNSSMQFASFFTASTNLTPDELKDLKNIIDLEIKRREK